MLSVSMTHHLSSYSDMRSTRTVSSSKLDKVNYMELYNTITEKRNQFHKMADITCNSFEFCVGQADAGLCEEKKDKFNGSGGKYLKLC